MRKRHEGCIECGSPDLEVFEDLDGPYLDSRCAHCNDRLIERAGKRLEWDHYHPGVPCPAIELD